MNQKELKELIEFLIEKDIAEFELERGDVKVKIKRAGAHTVVYASPEMHRPMAGSIPDPRQTSSAASSAVSSSPAAPAPVQAAPAEDLHVVKSPIVGTFYEAPSPGAPPFVKVGDMVEVGQVLCIIESMKLMNEIEAEVAGVVAAKLVENGRPVEYGEALFAILPR